MKCRMKLACTIATLLLTAWPVLGDEETPDTARIGDVYRQLLQQRMKNIERLQQYYDAGVFPRNHDFPGRMVPYFVDAHGAHCAVANLIAESGATDLVHQVVTLDNNIYVKDVKYGPVLDWMLVSGLTQEEYVHIQMPYIFTPPMPSYNPPYPNPSPLPNPNPLPPPTQQIRPPDLIVNMGGYPQPYPALTPGQPVTSPGLYAGYPSAYPQPYPAPTPGQPVASPGLYAGYPGAYPQIYPALTPGQPVASPNPDDKRLKEHGAQVDAELRANTFPSLEKAMTLLRTRNQGIFEGKSYSVVAPPADKTEKATLTLKNPSSSQQIEVVLTFFNGKGEIVKQEIPRFQPAADFHRTMLAVNQEVPVPYNCNNTWVVVEWTAGPALNITVPFQTVASARTETKSQPH